MVMKKNRFECTRIFYKIWKFVNCIIRRLLSSLQESKLMMVWNCYDGTYIVYKSYTSVLNFQSQHLQRCNIEFTFIFCYVNLYNASMVQTHEPFVSSYRSRFQHSLPQRNLATMEKPQHEHKTYFLRHTLCRRANGLNVFFHDVAKQSAVAPLD